MSKHTKRHRKARMIRAAASKVKAELIQAEAVGIEWIEAAAEGEQASKPKRFKIDAYSGGMLRVSRYDTPVVIDLAGLQAAAPVPILLDHDHMAIVGHADAVDVGTSSLKLSGIVSGVGEDADRVVAMAANGFPWRASVGAWPMELEWVGEGVTAKVNGKSFKGPFYVARKSELKEVSFVAVAADSRTSAKVAASAAQHKESDMDPEFKAWIEAMGLVAADLREDQIVKLQAKYDGELKTAAQKAAAAPPVEGAAPPTPKAEAPKFDLDAIKFAHESHETAIQAKAAEWQPKIQDAVKFAEIKAAGTKAALDLKSQALKEQWPAPRLEAEHIKAAALFEVELMRAERPTAPAIHASSRDIASAMPAIEAAFARSCGLMDPDKHYKPEVLEASDRYRSLGIQELLLIHANANGYTGRQIVNNGNLREVIQAAFSTHTLTTLLSTTGNKLLLEGFNMLPQSWRDIATTANVSDFKAVTAYRLTADLEYEEVGPAGEIKHGTLGQESYSMQAKTYAKMAALTRQDIINDDLGALNALRTKLGMGSAIKVNKVFWTLWINNSSFFTSARANLVTSSALGESGLNTAVAAFRNMEGPDGNMMGLEPVLLLVPSSLEATARKLYTSQEVRDTTASTKTMVANIYQNRFRPVVVPELENSGYTGYSATTWYLLADPRVLATAVMCFLDGQQSPTIESTDADFNTLGIQFRGYHDFGAAMTEYRAGVKATA